MKITSDAANLHTRVSNERTVRTQNTTRVPNATPDFEEEIHLPSKSRNSNSGMTVLRASIVEGVAAIMEYSCVN